MDTALAINPLLCKGCETYFNLTNGSLNRVPEDYVAESPVFGVPTQWSDLRNARPGAYMAPIAHLTDLALRKNQGVRLLDAAWPEGCCVCGQTTSRFETQTKNIIFAGSGKVNIGNNQATLVVSEIPHCAVHSGGVTFGQVRFALSADNTAYGLCFRSLKYRNQFRKLNPWPWSNLRVL